VRQAFGARFGPDLAQVRIHRDADAGAAAQQLGASAFALGHDIAFAPGRYDPDSEPGRQLLAHELAHVGQTAGQATQVMRHPVAPTPIARKTALEILGDGTPAHPGLTLAAFENYTRAQADWFVAATLAAADRDALWTLLLRATNVAPTLAGVGDVKLTELRAVAAADQPALDAFCRACHGASKTIAIASAAAYATLAERIDLGRTLLGLEALLPPEVLELTVSEAQLRDITTHGWLPHLQLYWFLFQPHLQGSHTVAAGADSEFQRVLNLVTAPGGIVPFLTLLGNVRNLHRFGVPMLTKLVQNFANFSRKRSVHLLIYTGHDDSAFQQSLPLFEDLVLNSPNQVLMLEGQTSLAAITARVPALTAAYGQKDKSGKFSLGQVMIAGHGSARSVQLAGTGAPTVVNGHVSYPSESLHLGAGDADSKALLDALLTHMDPATARLVYAGCLVGSNPVPVGTAPAAIPGHIAANPSLGSFTEQRGVALGLKPGFVSAARASVGLSAATSLRDPSGNLTINYPFDPAAFSSALAYVPVGHEPEGVMVAAVEVAASHGAVATEMLLRARLGAAGTTDPWWDECTLLMVNLALDGVAFGAGVDIARLNALAHTAQVPFLARWAPSFGITVAHFTGGVNPQVFANGLYTRLLATPTFVAAADARVRAGRLVAEQGFLASGAARAAPLITFLDATPALSADLIEPVLDTAATGPSSALLFPAAAAVTSGRLRLALAWLRKDPANADMRAFLDAQVLMPATGPELSPALRAELGGTPERDVLDALGRLVATAPAVGGAAPLPKANADLVRSARKLNDILIEPRPYEATVLPATLPVVRQPHKLSATSGRLRAGDRLRVMGFTHEWAGFDHGGKLAFVERAGISAP